MFNYLNVLLNCLLVPTSLSQIYLLNKGRTGSLYIAYIVIGA